MLKKFVKGRFVFSASSEFTLPRASLKTRPDTAIPEAELVALPDSDLWSLLCRTRVGFCLLGTPMLKALRSHLEKFDSLKIAFIVHKKRVMIQACAIMSLLERTKFLDWSQVRIYILGDHLSELEVKRACRVHNVPDHVIVWSKDDGTMPFQAVRRFFQT